MRKSAIVIAALAAAISTAALAAEKKSPAPAATQMSDSEMDRVTAGAASVVFPAPGVDITLPGQASSSAVGATITGLASSGVAHSPVVPPAATLHSGL